jgi:hypothetical protein
MMAFILLCPIDALGLGPPIWPLISNTTDQEVFVVMRYFDSDGEGRIDYNEFAEKILGKDVGQTNYNTTTSADGGDTLAPDDLSMDQAELDKYQSILIAAVENDRKKAFLKKSMEDFRKAAEGIQESRLRSMFKANDVEFKRQITYERFENLLMQQDVGDVNTGQWSLRMDKKEAVVVAEELFRQQGLTKKGSMTWEQYRNTFTTGK